MNCSSTLPRQPEWHWAYYLYATARSGTVGALVYTTLLLQLRHEETDINQRGSIQRKQLSMRKEEGEK